MPTSGIQRTLTANEKARRRSVDSTVREIRQLKELAVAGLARMFDSADQLFCFRMKRDAAGLVPEGVSHRYTLMSLLGLLQTEAEGLGSPVDVRNVLSRLLQQTGWISNLGDLGLVLWLCALALPERLEEMCSRLGLDRALARPEFGEGRTMELSWLLTGLSHATLSFPAARSQMTDLAVRTYESLKRNQGEHGIFGHLATGKTLAGTFRGRIGSFADQVYPIYALTRFAQAYEVRPALDMARKCANAICQAQGALGQWWWHYDSRSGKVAQRYPVYAVHQDGMAPMALFALGDAMRLDFSEPIYRGLAWITGNNELNCDLCDGSAAVIWRCIYRPQGWKKYIDEALEFVRPGRPAESVNGMKILFECRPYHLGWLLYAFGGRD